MCHSGGTSVIRVMIPPLQAKVQTFLGIVENGKSLCKSLKEYQGYKNPSFLEKMVDHQGIDQYGSGYPIEVFDPHALHPEVC